MKKTLAILLSMLMLVVMAMPVMAADATVCPACEKNTFIYYMTVTPTCTEQGYTLWKCNNAECGYEEKVDYVDALSHAFPDAYDHVDGGCLKETFDHRYCTRCGLEDKINVTAAPGHAWDEGVHHEANCTVAEHYVHTCTACGETKIEKVEGGDPYTYHKMVKISGPESCLDEAVEVYKCSKCGFEDKLEVAPVDHVDADGDGVCDVCVEELVLDEEPHGFYAKIIKWISEIVEAFKAFIAAIKG